MYVKYLKGTANFGQEESPRQPCYVQPIRARLIPDFKGSLVQCFITSLLFLANSHCNCNTSFFFITGR